MVVLHPEHFLPNSDLSFYHGTSTKHYSIGHDRALREAPGDSDNSPRLPPFSFDAPQEQGKMLNPFLVIINAEIRFRRFRRMGLAPLCRHYEELIDLTIQLVQLIYHQPLVEAIFERLDKRHMLDDQQTSAGVDVDEGEVRLRMDDQEDGDHTIKSSRRSRTGAGAVRHPGPGAVADEFIEYGQYLMSGRGMFLLCCVSFDSLILEQIRI